MDWVDTLMATFIGGLTLFLFTVIGYGIWYDMNVRQPAQAQCLLRGYPEVRIDNTRTVYCSNDKFAEPLGKVYGQ
jgi:hypothetical protein